MKYLYANAGDYGAFASGAVFYGRSGLANFPARLSREIFSRCLAYMEKRECLTVFDPCCGGGNLLAAVGFFGYGKIDAIYGMDADEDALATARKNLRLLTREGMGERAAQLTELYGRYGKKSHKDALGRAEELAGYAGGFNHEPEINLLAENALNDSSLDGAGFEADIVIADLPYGSLTEWIRPGGVSEAEATESGSIGMLLKNVAKVMSRDSVIALCSGNRVKITGGGFERLERQIVGKRKFEILRLAK